MCFHRLTGLLQVPLVAAHCEYHEHGGGDDNQADEDHGMLPSVTRGYLAAVGG